jgi:hypothetical protein
MVALMDGTVYSRDRNGIVGREHTSHIHHSASFVRNWIDYQGMSFRAALGLSDWAQELADEVAAAGYIAVAPDLLSVSSKWILSHSTWYEFSRSGQSAVSPAIAFVQGNALEMHKFSSSKLSNFFPLILLTGASLRSKTSGSAFFDGGLPLEDVS